MEKRHLAMATVPVQDWNTVYSQEEALLTGTIFPELTMPFYAAQSQSVLGTEGRELSVPGKSPEQREREALLMQIQQVSFVMDDVRLYLDTHPEDADGLKLLKQVLGARKALLREFAQKFYPLTPDCMAGIYETDPTATCYCWGKGPMPWEGACV